MFKKESPAESPIAHPYFRAPDPHSNICILTIGIVSIELHGSFWIHTTFGYIRSLQAYETILMLQKEFQWLHDHFLFLSNTNVLIDIHRIWYTSSLQF